MKATGIVRRIDDLGRVVMPKEIRRTMRIRGDVISIPPTFHFRLKYIPIMMEKLFLKNIHRLGNCRHFRYSMQRRCTKSAVCRQ